MSAVLDSANADQSAYWNGAAGRQWVLIQESQDRLFADITAALLRAAAPQPGEAAIDVGCGAGETTLQVAALTGAALGVDVSEPMLALARERAAREGSPARFALADATIYDFSREAADLMMSRFGVMFFAEPAKSFANLRRAVKPGGRLVFACWREPKLNAWLMTPYRAAQKQLPPQPKPPHDAPGPFAFADDARVRDILTTAGFGEISFTAERFELDVADGQGLDSAVTHTMALGPTSRALTDQPEAVREAVRGEIRTALAELAQGDRVPLGAEIWIVRARA